MNRFFGMDTKVYRFFAMAWNLIVLNLLTLLMCVPVITAGASLTAMHYVLLRLRRKEESYIGRMFWKAFRENFRQSTILWAAFLALFLSYRVDWVIVTGSPEVFGTPVRYLILILAILTFMLMQFVFPLQSRFANPVLITVKNAAILTVSRFPRVLAMTLVWVIPYEILVHSLALLPVVIMLGLSLPGFFCTRMYDPVFRALEPEEPEAPERSELLEESELPEESGLPEGAEVPEGPELPEESELPEGPEGSAGQRPGR